jgi:molybdenum cofactor biosynthesis enzyme MoaA
MEHICAEMSRMHSNVFYASIFICNDLECDVTEDNDLPFISLDEAMHKYDMFNIYVAHGENDEVFDYLVSKGINKKRIINYKWEYELYDGCEFLESQIILSNKMFFCCKNNEQMNEPPTIRWIIDKDEVDIKKSLDHFIETRNRLIFSIKKNMKSECTGCSEIKYGLYRKSKIIQSLTYGFDAPCQIACIYCKHINAKNIKSEYCSDNYDKEFMHMFPWKLFIELMEQREILSHDAIVNFGGGEITINRNKNILIESVSKYRIVFSTNAILYDKKIAELTKRPGSSIGISVDSGSKNGYLQIKQYDGFEIVWSNIERYISEGSNVWLKYVSLVENCNDTDIFGFINKALGVGAKFISISSDVLRKNKISDMQVRSIAKMLSHAQNNQLTVVLLQSTFQSEELLRINKELLPIGYYDVLISTHIKELDNIWNGIESLRFELNELTIQNIRLQKENMDLLNVISVVENENSIQRSLLANMQMENIDAWKGIDNFRSECKSMQSMITSLQKENEILLDTAHNLDKENELKIAIISSCQTDNENLWSGLLNLRKENSELRKIIIELQNENKELWNRL